MSKIINQISAYLDSPDYLDDTDMEEMNNYLDSSEPLSEDDEVLKELKRFLKGFKETRREVTSRMNNLYRSLKSLNNPWTVVKISVSDNITDVIVRGTKNMAIKAINEEIHEKKIALDDIDYYISFIESSISKITTRNKEEFKMGLIK